MNDRTGVVYIIGSDGWMKGEGRLCAEFFGADSINIILKRLQIAVICVYLREIMRL